jgi:hypothetical protein
VVLSADDGARVELARHATIAGRHGRVW